MSSGFPPIPIYPNGYDSDFTLFQVYNTSETVTVADTDAFSEEIPIHPQPAGSPEIWGDNGYATIAGELFYYDAVDTNGEGYVCRFRRCCRNLAGRETQFNSAGTWVRGYVVAEHHNQLANAILLIENFVGENFSPLPPTLDWRIRHLADAPIISDDVCPQVELDFNILSSSPITGAIASYAVTVNGIGTFVLQFGDGQSTSAITQGTHTYAPGATIDPVVVVTNDNCQTIQTQNTRTNPTTPTATTTSSPFSVPVPIPPTIPTILIPSIVVPPPVTNIPPIVFPCITPFSIPSTILPQINIPSMIDFAPISIPSQITFQPPFNVPSQIMGPDIQIPSQIDFRGPQMIPIGPAPPIPAIQIQPCNIPPIQVQPITSNVPSVIELIVPNIPSTIPIIITGQVIPKQISVIGGISLVGGQNISLVHSLQDLNLIHNLPESLKFESIPDVKFDVKSLKRVMKTFNQSFAETLAEALKVSLPDFSQMKMPNLKIDWGEIPTLKAVVKVARPVRGQSNDGVGGAGKREEPEFEHIDFPASIPLSVPEIPPIQLKHDIPQSIALDVSKLRNIRLDASSVPTEIRVLPPKEGLSISVVPFTVPSMKIDASALEGLFIPIKVPDVMPSINVKFPDEMPTLKVEFPMDMPTLKVEVPDNTRIPLFYSGDPIPVQVNLKIQDLAGEAADDVQCYHIMPCKSRK